MAQGEAVVSYNTLDLVELGQVCGVQGLISEHTVNGEVLGWCEGLLGVIDGQGQGMGQKISITVPSLSPTLPGLAAPSGPGDGGHGHWPLWYVSEANFSGPRPTSNCICTFRRKSEVHADALGAPTSFPLTPQSPGPASPLRAVATLGMRPLDPMDVVHGELQSLGRIWTGQSIIWLVKEHFSNSHRTEDK